MRLSAEAQRGRAASRGRARARGRTRRTPTRWRRRRKRNRKEKAPDSLRGDAARSPARAKWAGSAWATPLRPVWKYSEIVPVVAAGADAVPLRAGPAAGARAHALRGPAGRGVWRAARFGDRRVRGVRGGRAGATLACRPATPSSETVVRGLLGTVRLGAEADAFARAARRAGGGGRGAEARRGAPRGPDGPGRTPRGHASAAAAARRRGDLNAETLLNVLDVPRARAEPCSTPRRWSGPRASETWPARRRWR